MAPACASTVGVHSARRVRDYSRASQPSLGSPHRAVVKAIGSCEVASPPRSIRLAEPRATLLSDLEVPILRADQASLLRDDSTAWPTASFARAPAR
jgi:hypothetical protein